jgi:hypothetical protein
VRGPVDFWAFFWFACTCFSVAIIFSFRNRFMFMV